MLPAQGKLIIISTPIGNLDDISIRAINSLKSSDLIACENTKHSSILLNKYGIKTKKLAYTNSMKHPELRGLLKPLMTAKPLHIFQMQGHH